MATPKKQSADDPDFKLVDELKTEAVFSGKDYAHIRSFLKREKFTGTLMEDINIGGTSRFRFVQKQPVDIVK